MPGAILDVRRRFRVALWLAGLRLRLRRHGVRLVTEVGPGVRFFTRPVLEVDNPGDAPGGMLTLRIARSAHLGRDLVLDIRRGAESTLEIGAGVRVQSWCRLQLHGGRLQLGEFVHLRDLVQLKTKSSLTVGDRTVLSRDVIVHATAGVDIGHDCGIGERTSLIDSDHELDGAGGAFLQAPVRAEAITIGSGVAVAANCVVLRGSRMGDGSALAAGAVLNGDVVEPGHLAGGVPARTLKNLRALS